MFSAFPKKLLFFLFLLFLFPVNFFVLIILYYRWFCWYSCLNATLLKQKSRSTDFFFCFNNAVFFWIDMSPAFKKNAIQAGLSTLFKSKTASLIFYKNVLPLIYIKMKEVYALFHLKMNILVYAEFLTLLILIASKYEATRMFFKIKILVLIL